MIQEQINKFVEKTAAESAEKESATLQALKELRKPFPDNQISKLPKPTKAQTEALKADFKKGIRCKDCGQWHLPEVVHLDYVGHAALTSRLLDVDPLWNWEPLSFTPDGLPRFDSTGGLWIKLTVAGITRLGYGHAEGGQFKDSGAREKEVIGDALRNAGMRFGAALNLWHKGDLYLDHDEEGTVNRNPVAQQKEKTTYQPPMGQASGSITAKTSAPMLNNVATPNVTRNTNVPSTPTVKNHAPNAKTGTPDWLNETQNRVLGK